MKATWWRQATEGSTYWRCTVPAKHLPGRVNKLIPADLAEKDGEPYFPNQVGGTAVWPFSGNATRAVLMAEMKEQGFRVLLEVDDNYLTPAPFQPDWQVDFARGGPSEHGDRSSNAAHRRIAEWVDGVIVSTPYLAERYENVNENVFVCPNSVDPDDWPEPLERDETFRIGWAASHSHHVDESLARRAMEWAVRQKGVEVYLIGYQPAWNGPFKRIGWTDSLDEYREQLTGLRLDVGICPLKPGAWADGKSDVKALEYAMAGAFPVCSNVEPYRAWKGPVLWAQKPADFERALRWCVLNPDDVREGAKQARDYVLAERTIQKSIHLWEEACA